MPDSTASPDAPATKPRGAKAIPIYAGIVVAILIATVVSVSMFTAGQQKDQEGQVLGVNTTADGLIAEANITSVDPLKNEMQVRVTLNPEGSYDDDGLLARPVTLYYDTLSGTKQVDFKAKKPLGSVDLSLPLVGSSVSSYPWDVYDAEIDLLFLTTSASESGSGSTGSDSTGSTGSSPSTSTPPTTGTTETVPGSTPSTVAGDPGEETPEGGPEAGTGDDASAPTGGVVARPIGFTGPQQAEKTDSAKPATTKEPSVDDFDTIVPISLTVYKTVPAYNVVEIDGASGEDSDDGLVHATFTVKRAPTAQAFSVAVSAVMWFLSLGVLFLAVSVITGRRKLELTHISVMAVVMFALPAALRSFQPGIPPPGVLSDFYSFFWCDIIVGCSLIATLYTYLLRKPE